MAGKKKQVKSDEVQGVFVNYDDKVTVFVELVGKTFAEVKAALVDLVNLHAGASVSVEGKDSVRKNYKLKPGDSLLCESPEPVRVVFGDKDVEKLEFVGKTVGEVKAMLPKNFKLPVMMETVIDDEKVDDAHVLESGDELKFSYPTVKVTCGSNGADHSNLIGITVAAARKCLAETMNIPKDADAYVGGQAIEKKEEKNVTLKQGDELEFIKEDGQKA